MFFDNKKYFDFVDKCRDEGITIPIIPGIKILDKPRQIESLEKIFHINLPNELKNEAKQNINHIDEIGTVGQFVNQKSLLMQVFRLFIII